MTGVQMTRPSSRRRQQLPATPKYAGVLLMIGSEFQADSSSHLLLKPQQ